MATRDEIYTAIRNADKAGDAESVQKLGAYLQTMQAPAPPVVAESRGLKGMATDLAAGAVRGAGSIGATLLAPVDAAARAMGVQNDYIGRTDRREQMDAGLKSLGADPTSGSYQVGKVGAEVAGTLGVGGAIAAPLRGAAPALAEAIGTAGMRAGGATGVPNALLRMVGGGTTGAASAGLVDPSTVGTGAAVGAALPPVLAGAGKLGGAIGSVISGPGVSASVAAGAQAGRQAGYVIPPSQVNPTLLNRAMEGTAGKITTAQNASAKNQEVTNKLVRDALGLPADTAITPQVLEAVRRQAGQAYDAVGSAGLIKPGPAYDQALDQITANARKAAAGFPNAKANPLIAEIESLRSPEFDASSAIAKIKSLRADSDSAYVGGNTELAKALKSGANALEDAIDAHLQASGAPASLLQDFRGARQLIAKTYSAQKGLNVKSGNIDASKLAADLQKGKPLSGELRQIAEFSAQFPKATQTVERMGSLPQVSPLDLVGSVGGVSAMGPLGAAIPLMRPIARSAALSPFVQNRLIPQQQAPNALAALLADPAMQLGYRAAPVGSSSR